MTITIKINTDNAAFEDREAEVERIIKDWARQAQFVAGCSQPLRDYTGNTVGSVTVTGK